MKQRYLLLPWDYDDEEWAELSDAKKADSWLKAFRAFAHAKTRLPAGDDWLQKNAALQDAVENALEAWHDYQKLASNEES